MAKLEPIVVNIQGFKEVEELVAAVIAYQSYYGTSPAQVKHLQECGVCDASRCCEASFFCPDYPSD